MIKSAILSPCETYRYHLTRDWSGKGQSPRVCFIMLNPSTADGNLDDPTIRRCMGFARDWGFQRLEVVNLFAFRTAFPTELAVLFNRDPVAPVGPDNDDWIRDRVRGAELTVAAWGGHWVGEKRGAEVREALRAAGTDLKCLARTKYGSPKHPLYMPTTSRPEAFE